MSTKHHCYYHNSASGSSTRALHILEIKFRPPSPARVFPSSGFYQFSRSRRVDEENYSWYSHKEFYPIRIGDLIRDRYQVITKLGYGTSSTSWLCRDLR